MNKNHLRFFEAKKLSSLVHGFTSLRVHEFTSQLITLRKQLVNIEIDEEVHELTSSRVHEFKRKQPVNIEIVNF